MARHTGPIKGYYAIGVESDTALSPYGGNKSVSRSLPSIKSRVKQIAHDLCYPYQVQKDIDKAQSEEEIDRIMRSARKGEYD